MVRVVSPVRTRLTNWHLKYVPFPAIPFVDPMNADPLINGSVFAPELRSVEIEHIRREILKGGFDDLPARWSWVWALRLRGRSLGMGKSALLTYIADQINTDYGKKFFGHAAHWLAVYVPVKAKMRSVGQVAAVALASICSNTRGLSIEQLLLARLRHRVLALGLLGRDQHTNLNSAAPKVFAKERWLVAHNIDLMALASAVEQHLCEQHVTPVVAHAFATGSFQDYLAQLNGDAFLFSPKPGFVNKAPSLLLNDVAIVTRTAGIKRVSFLLDDFFHLISKASDGEKLALATDFRDAAVDGKYFAVQNNLYNWVAVMHKSFAPNFGQAWKERRMDQTAPLLPDKPSSVVLRAIPIERGPTLLEAYLSYHRPTRAPSPIYPFTAEALDMLTHIAAEPTGEGKYDPGTLLQHANLVINEALRLTPDPAPIGPSFVQHVLQGTPLPATTLVNGDDEEPDTERSLEESVPCTCTCHNDPETATVYDTRARVLGGTNTILYHYCANCKSRVAV